MNEQQQFRTVNDLEDMILDLPEAHAESLHRGRKLGDKKGTEYKPSEKTFINQIDAEPARNYVAIINEESDKIATIASTGYDLRTHAEVFYPVYQAIREEDLLAAARFRTWNQKNVIQLEVFFPGTEFSIDGQTFELGLRVVNSYDRTSSQKAQPIGRGSGAIVYLDRLIEVDGIYRNHYGQMAVAERYTEFFEDLLESQTNFRELFRAADDQIVKAKVATVMKNIGARDKYVEAVDEQVRARLGNRYSRLDIFLTYADVVGDEDVGFSTLESKQKKARDILQKPLEQLEKIDEEDE